MCLTNYTLCLSELRCFKIKICRTKYQKNVEASHNKGLKIVPNSIRSENYTVAFEVEEEKYEPQLQLPLSRIYFFLILIS
jgi:hypothetical protein